MPPHLLLALAGVLAAARLGLATASSLAPNPKADPAAVVVSGDGHVRVTVFTSRMVRLEYAESKQFEDRESYSFNNRNVQPVPRFQHHALPHGGVQVNTTDLVIEYTPPATPTPAPTPAPFCDSIQHGADAFCGDNTPCSEFHTATQPPPNQTLSSCCAGCQATHNCNAFVFATDSSDVNCWYLVQISGSTPSPNRAVGGRLGPAPRPGFTADTLKITAPSGAFDGTWTVDRPNPRNLLGTVRSLDGVTGGVDINCTSTGFRIARGQYCATAPISRDGWSVYDDSENDVIDPATQWLAPRNTSGTYDLYFFAHGTDYRAGLLDFTKIAGAVPDLDPFVFGIYYSRYWPYTAENLQDIARGYRERSIPLSVLVSDMAWHYRSGIPPAWAGYSFSPFLFPDIDIFLAWLAENNLHITLNLHLGPVTSIEPKYNDFARALGLDPASLNGTEIPSPSCPPPYNAGSVVELLQTSPRFGRAYLDLLDSIPMTYPWLDDEPWWVARILFENTKKYFNGRGIGFARFSGLGCHRYPHLFSGDTFIAWSSLNFQPAFTATAANVLAYWSHDIGGHRSHHDEQAYDPELYLRWLQWGTHAPIFRTHPQPDPKVLRRPYAYPLPYSEYMSEAMQRRGRLVPLLRTAFYRFGSTAISPIHALYLDWPTLDGAYTYNNSFVFCDTLLVNPVTAPVANATQLAEVTLWLPPGSWVDTALGDTIVVEASAGTTITRSYAMFESPVFARAGAVLPLAPPITTETAWGVAPYPAHLSQGASLFATGANATFRPPLAFEVWPGGSASGAGANFDDDLGWTNASYAMGQDRSSLEFSVVFADANAPLPRAFVLEMHQAWPAASVRPCASASSTVIGRTRYDGAKLMQEVAFSLPPGAGGHACVALALGQGLSFVDPLLLNSTYVGKRQRANILKASVDLEIPQPHPTEMPFVTAINTAVRLPLDPKAELAKFPGALDSALPTLFSNPAINSSFATQISAWLK